MATVVNGRGGKMSEDVSAADVVVDAAAPDLWPGTEAGQGGGGNFGNI